jgi:hypothetical protein
MGNAADDERKAGVVVVAVTLVVGIGIGVDVVDECWGWCSSDDESGRDDNDDEDDVLAVVVPIIAGVTVAKELIKGVDEIEWSGAVFDTTVIAFDPLVDDRFFWIKLVLVVLVFVGCLSKGVVVGGGGNGVAFDIDLLCVLLLVVPPVVAVLVPATVVDVDPAPPIIEPPLFVAALVLWLLLLLFWLLIIPRFGCIWSFVVVVVDDIDDEAPWNDSNGISCSGNGGDKRSYNANSCVHLIRLSRFVVWYGGVVPCIRSCSAKIVSVNDGYFELDVVIVVDGTWLVDFVIIVFDDWAYSFYSRN